MQRTGECDILMRVCTDLIEEVVDDVCSEDAHAHLISIRPRISIDPHLQDKQNVPVSVSDHTTDDMQTLASDCKIVGVWWRSMPKETLARCGKCVS